LLLTNKQMSLLNWKLMDTGWIPSSLATRKLEWGFYEIVVVENRQTAEGSH
jgi:hypothetical protein